jgi:hypothetical protein
MGTDERADKTKPIVAFYKIENAPKNSKVFPLHATKSWKVEVYVFPITGVVCRKTGIDVSRKEKKNHLLSL